MTEIPGTSNILRGELNRTRDQLEGAMTQLETMAFARRTFEEMLCSVVREVGEKMGDHTYRLEVSKNSIGFSNQPFVFEVEPNLETGGVVFKFHGRLATAPEDGPSEEAGAKVLGLGVLK